MHASPAISQILEALDVATYTLLAAQFARRHFSTVDIEYGASMINRGFHTGRVDSMGLLIELSRLYMRYDTSREYSTH